jgi:hypothetical protein
VDPEALVSGASVLFVPEPKPSGEQNWEWCAVGCAPVPKLRGVAQTGPRVLATTLVQIDLERHAATCVTGP